MKQWYKTRKKDPFYIKAKKNDIISRAYYKLEEIDKKSVEHRKLDNELLNNGQKIFGYTQEDLKVLMTPMAVTGQEAIGSVSYTHLTLPTKRIV